MITSILNTYIHPTMSTIATHLQSDFIVAGSFPAACVAKNLPTDSSFDLPFNDVDFFHGTFGNELPIKMITHSKADLNLPAKCNLVKCVNLNMEYVKGCDINMAPTGEVNEFACEAQHINGVFIGQSSTARALSVCQALPVSMRCV